MKCIKEIIVISLLFFICNLSYSQMIKLNTKELVQYSTHIFVGDVEKLEYIFDEANKRIYTKVSIKLQQILKGKSILKLIQVLYPGGIYKNDLCIVSGMPKFKVNEKVMIFSEFRSDGLFKIVGGFQGKFTIENNKLKEKNIQLNDFMDEIKNYLTN